MPVCHLLLQRGNQKAAGKAYTERLSEVWTEYKCNPMKSVASIVIQLPIFVGFFSSLRSFAEAKVGPGPVEVLMVTLLSSNFASWPNEFRPAFLLVIVQ